MMAAMILMFPTTVFNIVINLIYFFYAALYFMAYINVKYRTSRDDQ